MAFLEGQSHHIIGADCSVQLGFEVGVCANFGHKGIQLGFRHGATDLVHSIPSQETGIWHHSPKTYANQAAIAIWGSRVESDSKISL